MNRRYLLEGLALLPALPCRSLLAQIVPETDSRLEIARVSYTAGATTINGYLAQPKGGGKRPAVMVIHENRGLTPHIQDVARRMALEGFLAFAPDMLTPLGGTPANEADGPAMIAKLDAGETVARLAAGVNFLAKHAACTGKVGVVGFSWGGGMVNRVMASGAPLSAGVPYYGAQIPAADVPKISGPLLLHYAGNDARINAGIPEYEAALKANKKPYQIYTYEGAGQGFNNDTGGARYNKEAAQLAWSRTVEFLKKHLA
jgi:carboxymethylenebutenolidase